MGKREKGLYFSDLDLVKNELDRKLSGVVLKWQNLRHISLSAAVATFGFPAGLRVLVVDDDPTCLKTIEKLLWRCQYNVTTCPRAETALSMLRERRGDFDLILSDVHMPDMDGFKLLELIGLEMDLPVIMISGDDGKDVVMKGVIHGAVDYILKPVRFEAVKIIWQHVVRKYQQNEKGLERVRGERMKMMKLKKWISRKIRHRHKEARVVWSADLHQKFVSAVNELGVDKAVPEKILELMGVPDITRENVASHLQKYRMYLKRLSETEDQNTLGMQLSGATNSTYASISSVDRFCHRGLTVPRRHPLQNQMNLQAGVRQLAATGTGISLLDRINLFDSNAQISNASKFVPGQQLINNGQMNTFSRSSANMESRQSQQMLQTYSNIGLQARQGTSGFLNSFPVNTGSTFSLSTSSVYPRNSIIPMAQQGRQFDQFLQQNNLTAEMSTTGQIMNGVAGELDQNRLYSNIGQQILGNGAAIGNRGTSQPDTLLASSYGSTPQTLYPFVGDNYTNPSTGNSFPNVSSMATQNISPGGTFGEPVPSRSGIDSLDQLIGLKGVENFTPSYCRNTGIVTKKDVPTRTEPGCSKTGGIVQCNNSVTVPNPAGVTSNSTTNEVPNVLSDQQEGNGVVDPDFNCDTFYIEDILNYPSSSPMWLMEH
ncbi:hypothetical protein J5N97_000897 [Dioscorea zingiberensis]|uniref:Response regulatory domain-containing protein n=1 Tax=Dioscorea zingiberensis TaxID=325984 RepID=A0A9D5BUN6_9LILI|nr:hypothetical protein J5N97_000897 [Dioscorea zingiberensis]